MESHADLYCFHVCAALGRSSVLLVGKTRTQTNGSSRASRTRCVEVRDVGRRLWRVLSGAEAQAIEAEQAAGVAGCASSLISLHVADGRGQSEQRQVLVCDVLPSETTEPQSDSFARSLLAAGHWHHHDATPLASAVRLHGGPGWLRLRLNDRQEPSVDGFDDVVPLTADRSLPTHWRLLALAVGPEANGQLLVAARVLTVESLLEWTPGDVAMPGEAQQRAAWTHQQWQTQSQQQMTDTLTLGRFPDEKSAAHAVGAFIVGAAPDLVVCYDEPAWRRLLSSVPGCVRDARARPFDPRPSASSSSDTRVTVNNARARPWSSYVWADAEALARQHQVRFQQRPEALAALYVDADAARGVVGQTTAWLRLLAATHALPIGLEHARATSSLWQWALQQQQLLLSECMLARHLERCQYAPFQLRTTATNTEEPYRGGLVMQALVGVYGLSAAGSKQAQDQASDSNPDSGLDPDVCLHMDVSSMYPSLCVEHAHALDIDDNGGRVVPPLMRELVERRRQAASEGRAIEAVALKLAANAFYGSLGSPLSRFEQRELAARITAAGRQLLERLAAHIVTLSDNEQTVRVVAADTDACFVVVARSRASEVRARIERYFSEHYRFMRIKCEAMYARLVVVNAKSWLGVDAASGAVVKRGVGANRGDCALVARLVDACVEAAARDRPVAPLLELAKERLRAVCTSAHASADLVATMQMKRRPEQYGQQRGIVAVAVEANARGYRYGAGAHVPYVLAGTSDAADANNSETDANNEDDGEDASTSSTGSRMVHPDALSDSVVPSADAYMERIMSLLRPLLAALGQSVESTVKKRASGPTPGSAFAERRARSLQTLSVRTLGPFSASLATLVQADYEAALKEPNPASGEHDAYGRWLRSELGSGADSDDSADMVESSDMSIWF